jgi:nucleoside-triphosphatase THEP1
MMPNSRKIAAIDGNDCAAAQVLLAEMAAEWRGAGVKIAGVTAEGHGLPGRTCGAGFLRDLTSGKAHTIYLEAPLSGASCHLDTGGVAGAGVAVITRIPTSDLVILNKFGKLEAMGGGLAAAFAAAIAADKPLLTTVSEKHRDAWSSFAPHAIFLRGEKAVLRDWWQEVRTGRTLQEERQFLSGSGQSASLR